MTTTKITKIIKIRDFLITILIIALLLLGVINSFLKAKSYYSIISYDLSLEEFQEYSLDKVDYIGTCKADSMSISVDIYWTSDFKDGLQGLFNHKLGVILLGSSDIDVVSHEISHFIDYAMYRKGIRDTETRAYLQGYFTKCIWNLGD